MKCAESFFKHDHVVKNDAELNAQGRFLNIFSFELLSSRSESMVLSSGMSPEELDFRSERLLL